MSKLLNRVAEVTVTGKTSERKITGLRITFDIEKTVTSNPNQGVIKIYNLNEKSRSAFEEKNARVTLKCGYVGNVRQLFVGDVRRVAHLKQGPDWITEIEAGEGQLDFNLKISDASFAKGTSVKDVIESVTGKFDSVKELAGNILETGKNLVKGFVASGSASKVLDDLTQTAGLEWSIQENSLQILKQGTGTQDSAILLTPETGLLGSPAKTLIGVNVTTLLNTELRPGRIVQIDSREFDETNLRVQSVAHKGDSYSGVWQSVAELEAITSALN